MFIYTGEFSQQKQKSVAPEHFHDFDFKAIASPLLLSDSKSVRFAAFTIPIPGQNYKRGQVALKS